MTIALPRLDRSTAADRGLTIADILVPVTLAERTPTRLRHAVLIVIGTAVGALMAQIYIPTEPVPFTGQSLGVLVVGGALGFRRGAAAMLLYLAIGLVGLPVYAQGDAGRDVLFGPTGGYLIGFVVAAAVVGRLAELGWDRRLGAALVTMLVGSAFIYLIGVPWLKVATGQSWAWAIANGLTPFLLWDSAKVLIAAALFPAAWWMIGRRPEDR
jgi:biotin transport system substrate-specific component